MKIGYNGENRISDEELLQTKREDLCRTFPKQIYGYTKVQLRRLKMEATMKKKGVLDKAIEYDRASRQNKLAGIDIKRRYEESLKIIERLERELSNVSLIRETIETFRIEPKKISNTSEATCVWNASDWHIEESVDSSRINGLNQYNIAIASERAKRFFQHGLRLTNILAKDIEIKTIVLALLGDFISNDIHDEFPEVNELEPIHAIIRVQNMIASGIEYILENSDYSLVIPCHSGNHARTTPTTRFSTESGHSLEYYMYHFLADHFRSQPRVKFIIPEGYHSYLDIYGLTVRFHHGHAIRYGGGVGGLYIPVNKAIAQWNKGRRADLDVFGHFHQMRDGGNFVCNGSMIGYNAFALSIKADYEKPKQALFLIDKKRGKTCLWPILFE